MDELNALLDKLLRYQRDAAIWAEQFQFDSEAYCVRRISEVRNDIIELFNGLEHSEKGERT